MCVNLLNSATVRLSGLPHRSSRLLIDAVLFQECRPGSSRNHQHAAPRLRKCWHARPAEKPKFNRSNVTRKLRGKERDGSWYRDSVDIISVIISGGGGGSLVISSLCKALFICMMKTRWKAIRKSNTITSHHEIQLSCLKWHFSCFVSFFTL